MSARDLLQLGVEQHQAILAALGLALLLGRLWPRRQALSPSPVVWPKVSIIVPARNESQNLKVLLPSLALVDYPDLEVIVVDDESEDDTAAIARAHGVRVLSLTQRPAGYIGKSWACQNGASIARGELLLFTDADTEFLVGGLRQAVAFLLAHRADMISTLPFHAARALWEKSLAPFHLLLLSMTGPYAKPRPKRVFAIGQFLLFRRSSYQELGGHAAVRSHLVEDLPLAALTLSSGKRYLLFTAARVYKVRMYDSLADFIAGWRRNFVAGFRYGSPTMTLVATLVIAALLGGGALGWNLAASLVAVSTWLAMACLARRFGNFPWALTILAWPWALVLFVGISLLAAHDQWRKKPIRWKGRQIAVST